MEPHNAGPIAFAHRVLGDHQGRQRRDDAARFGMSASHTRDRDNEGRVRRDFGRQSSRCCAAPRATLRRRRPGSLACNAGEIHAEYDQVRDALGEFIAKRERKCGRGLQRPQGEQLPPHRGLTQPTVGSWDLDNLLHVPSDKLEYHCGGKC